jgi:hypothetical protein
LDGVEAPEPIMRNKPYVLGLLAAAALLIYLCIRAASGDTGPVFALVPGALALALIAAAFKVAKADSFAPKKTERWDHRRTPELERWLNRREDQPTSPSDSAPPPRH